MLRIEQEWTSAALAMPPQKGSTVSRSVHGRFHQLGLSFATLETLVFMIVCGNSIARRHKQVFVIGDWHENLDSRQRESGSLMSGFQRFT